MDNALRKPMTEIFLLLVPAYIYTLCVRKQIHTDLYTHTEGGREGGRERERERERVRLQDEKTDREHVSV